MGDVLRDLGGSESLKNIRHGGGLTLVSTIAEVGTLTMRVILPQFVGDRSLETTIFITMVADDVKLQRYPRQPRYTLEHDCFTSIML